MPRHDIRDQSWAEENKNHRAPILSMEERKARRIRECAVRQLETGEFGHLPHGSGAPVHIPGRRIVEMEEDGFLSCTVEEVGHRPVDIETEKQFSSQEDGRRHSAGTGKNYRRSCSRTENDRRSRSRSRSDVEEGAPSRNVIEVGENSRSDIEDGEHFRSGFDGGCRAQGSNEDSHRRLRGSHNEVQLPPLLASMLEQQDRGGRRGSGGERGLGGERGHGGERGRGGERGHGGERGQSYPRRMMGRGGSPHWSPMRPLRRGGSQECCSNCGGPLLPPPVAASLSAVHEEAG